MSPDDDPLAQAFSELRSAIERAEATVRSAPAYDSDIERAAGYQHLVRSMKKAIEAAVLQDADQPYFRILDHWQREGGDCADQRYAFSPVRGGETYRIWGSVGSAARVEVQIYGGDPWALAGASLGYLAHEDLNVAPDGTFEVLLSPDIETGNGDLNLPAESTSVFVRHIWSDWADTDPGHAHIDRVGHEGDRVLPATSTDIAERLQTAAATLDRAVGNWPAFVQTRFIEAREPNEMSKLLDTYSMGGVKGRWMASGHFLLEPGQALVITTHPTDAAYQAVQLVDMWFSSLEYANLTSSLTTTQSALSADGAFHTVISATDPGHPNWLDTGGHTRGVFQLRFDGVPGEIPEDQRPTSQVVDIDRLGEVLPAPNGVAGDRSATRAERRRHVQRRTNR